MTLNELGQQFYKRAQEKGWRGPEDTRSFPEEIALMHSELSEALEEFRNGHGPAKVYFSGGKFAAPKPEGVPIELADLIIRVLETCHHHGIDIDKAVEMKHGYNATRSFRHGGKKL